MFLWSISTSFNHSYESHLFYLLRSIVWVGLEGLQTIEFLEQSCTEDESESDTSGRCASLAYDHLKTPTAYSFICTVPIYKRPTPLLQVHVVACLYLIFNIVSNTGTMHIFRDLHWFLSSTMKSKTQLTYIFMKLLFIGIYKKIRVSYHDYIT